MEKELTETLRQEEYTEVDEETPADTVLFTSEVTHDLPARKEVNKLYERLQLSGIVREVMVGIMLVVLFVFLCLIQHSYVFYARTYFVFIVCYWGSKLFTLIRNRNGGSVFKRMLASNGGKPIHNRITFTDSGIRVLNTFTESASEYAYDQIRSVAQSKNYFLLYRSINQCTVVGKNTLTGGTAEEFLGFLREKCTNWPYGILRTPSLFFTVRRIMLFLWAAGLFAAIYYLFIA